MSAPELRYFGIRVERNKLDENRRRIDTPPNAAIVLLTPSGRNRTVELTAQQLLEVAEDATKAAATMFRLGELTS